MSELFRKKPSSCNHMGTVTPLVDINPVNPVGYMRCDDCGTELECDDHCYEAITTFDGFDTSDSICTYCGTVYTSLEAAEDKTDRDIDEYKERNF